MRSSTKPRGEAERKSKLQGREHTATTSTTEEKTTTTEPQQNKYTGQQQQQNFFELSSVDAAEAALPENTNLFKSARNSSVIPIIRDYAKKHAFH